MVIYVYLSDQKDCRVSRTLRLHFDGASVAYRDDETQQFATDLFESSAAKIVECRRPERLAEIAAN